MITAVKAKPDTVSYGSIGNCSLGYLTLTLVQQAGGFKIGHIPYQDGGPIATDALGGQIELAIGSVTVLAPHVKGGKSHAIGGFSPAPDGRLLAYQTSAGGSEIGVLRVIDTATGREVTPAESGLVR